MALVTWGPEYSINVRAMDEQHQKLVDAMNDLHAAIAAGQANGAAGRLLQELVQYTKGHLKAEEALLARHHYPELAAHREKHTALTRQVAEYVGRYEAGEKALTVHLLHFLRDWLMSHIQKEDRIYAAWLNARGVQ